MASRPTLLDFPCDYPFKVIGVATEGFAQEVLDIVTRHIGPAVEADMRASRQGHYLSVSFTIQANSIEQIDALYGELTARPDVRFVL
ncbi:MAG: DUF493 family protein [Proteobacteria bacterium]|nr:DUF493 family protein [Pseudomonadota bacterium]